MYTFESKATAQSVLTMDSNFFLHSARLLDALLFGDKYWSADNPMEVFRANAFPEVFRSRELWGTLDFPWENSAHAYAHAYRKLI